MAYNTPNPWIYDPETGEIHHHDGDVDPLVATINLEDVDPDQGHADGRLMAAAVYLREAIESLLDLHITHHNHPDHAAARALIERIEDANRGT